LRIGDCKLNGHILLFCRNTFLDALAIGRKRRNKLRKTWSLPGNNVHNNTGNSNAASIPDLITSVVKFITNKGTAEEEVYATRLIRCLSGHELCDEEKSAVGLPSNTPQCERYEKYCFHRGWAINSDCKGKYPKI
jgi:hypothetical protein